MTGFEAFERKHSVAIDIVVAIALIAGIAGLFLFDIFEPRGVVDGVGYAALVALCVRFGGRVIFACAVLTTILTLIAAFLLPDSGISVAGMWGNRAFAIASIWIVAGILLRRLQLASILATREARLQEDQTALGRIVREALLTDNPITDRLQTITEVAGEAMQADFTAVLQGIAGTPMLRINDAWDRKRGIHFTLPNVPINVAEGYKSAMQDEFVVHTEDVRQSEIHQFRVQLFDKLGIRSLLVADTFVNTPGLGAIMFAHGEPHRWTAQEIAFARGVANHVALLFTTGKNAETLAGLDAVSEGIYIENAGGVVQYANRAAKALSHSDASTSEAAFPRPGTPLQAASDMHEVAYDARDLELQRIQLPNGGTLTRINDVTERNAALTVRRQLEARLQQSAKMDAIGQLAGGIAHDFNNILGSILGFAGFLAQDLPPRSAEHGFAERILSACERGKDLVEQVLAFARARAVERGVVDISLLLKRNEKALAELMPEKVDLRISLSDRALPVFGSSAQIDQLITNLCINARDAFDGTAGSIVITARPAFDSEIASLANNPGSQGERIFGEVQPGKSYCLLRFEDTGSGIDPNVLDRIFEPFFTTKGRHHSAGLGLAVAHGVVVSTGGVCHVRSVPGQGTAFSIYLPLAAEIGIEANPAGAEPVGSRGSERILIVDDERDIADMLAIGLQRLGYETVGVDDPVEALAAFTENPQAFDVVITDQVMPGMRGLDLIRKVKEIKPDIKAILCTGYSEGANADVSLAAGADAYFHKPVDARQIAPGIRTLFEQPG